MRSESLPPAWLTSVRVAGCLQLLPPGASVALYLGSRQPGSANPQCQRCCQEAVSLQLHPIDSKALQYAFSSRHATSGWFLIAQTEEKPRLRLRKDEMLGNLGTKLPLPSQVPLKTHAGRASGTEERRYTYPQGPRITLCTRSTGKHRPCHQLLSSTLGLAQTSSEANCPFFVMQSAVQCIRSLFMRFLFRGRAHCCSATLLEQPLCKTKEAEFIKVAPGAPRSAQRNPDEGACQHFFAFTIQAWDSWNFWSPKASCHILNRAASARGRRVFSLAPKGVTCTQPGAKAKKCAWGTCGKIH